MFKFSKAERPARTRKEGLLSTKPSEFLLRMPMAAQRYINMRQTMLWPNAEPPVNPRRSRIEDFASFTEEIKATAMELGADVVGVAAYDKKLLFSDAVVRPDKTVIVMGAAMDYDSMSDIGAVSQEEVHRVYHHLDELAVRMAQRICSYGYSAKAQANSGDFPLPAIAQYAGIGELGKHGSLISPDLGSSLRLVAVSTDMPLLVDGPKDYGIDNVCLSCNICTRFCPGDAIKPDKATVNGVTRWYVDTPACDPWFRRMHGCKICLAVCPLNTKGKFKQAYKKVAKDINTTKDAQGLLKMIKERTGIDYEAVGDISDKPMEDYADDTSSMEG